MDTVEANEALGFPADRRDYGIGMQILVDLGLQQDPAAHEQPGEARRPRRLRPGSGRARADQATPNKHNGRYLETKRDKLGHFIDMPG